MREAARNVCKGSPITLAAARSSGRIDPVPGAGQAPTRSLRATQQPEKPLQGIALLVQVRVSALVARLDTVEAMVLQAGTDFGANFQGGQAGFGYAAQVGRTEPGRDGGLIEQFLGHRIHVTPDGGWPARVKEFRHFPTLSQALA